MEYDDNESDLQEMTIFDFPDKVRDRCSDEIRPELTSRNLEYLVEKINEIVVYLWKKEGK